MPSRSSIPSNRAAAALRQNGITHLCPLYGKCGYQRQKPLAEASDVIVCAHDSLFHMKAEAIGTVGLLVIDEGFWQAGLRGLDGKAKLTLDGLEPVRSSPACYTRKNKLNIEGTADLVAARMKLWKALHVSEPGVLRHGLLAATGLTVEECRKAAALEHRRLRNAGLLPGMDGGRTPCPDREDHAAGWHSLGAAGPLCHALAHSRRGAGKRPRRSRRRAVP